MIVRLGYVAMSTLVKNASPSKTMTVTQFDKLNNREAAVRKLERIGAENLHNTLRLLRHNRAYEIQVYRFSSKLIPLFGHEMLEEWDPVPTLGQDFAKIGDYCKKNGMRVSFHPDHFTVLSTPRQDVLEKSLADLERHTDMLNAMGLGLEAKCNIHVGGAYGNKLLAGERFIQNFSQLRADVQRRITLENDDKTFTALETLEIAEKLSIPMVLDIHHHQVNNNGEEASDLWPRIQQTWRDAAAQDALSQEEGVAGREAEGDTREEGWLLPPKIHASSPKTEKDPRSHADYVEPGPLLDFLRSICPSTPRLDIMLEAKMKDEALLRLMKDLTEHKDVNQLSQASVEVFL
ncbi:UV DNA damage repair endonuclease UvsE [Paenibacillus eucommiae]|uniref:UV DNA damage endonuclease n=1 Tax=Paenibacillus eucommiae TaxID=1355755 RepID=A0ABS4IZB3_9BACL|nr:UV DNA damage repair endonuclease UvsE [Paenibacillus eucommiae]MBP1992311.1 UV DNA damage endonuclease [Paenibacillus eucommiae]